MVAVWIDSFRLVWQSSSVYADAGFVMFGYPAIAGLLIAAYFFFVKKSNSLALGVVGGVIISFWGLQLLFYGA